MATKEKEVKETKETKEVKKELTEKEKYKAGLFNPSRQEVSRF